METSDRSFKEIINKKNSANQLGQGCRIFMQSHRLAYGSIISKIGAATLGTLPK